MSIRMPDHNTFKVNIWLIITMPADMVVGHSYEAFLFYLECIFIRIMGTVNVLFLAFKQHFNLAKLFLSSSIHLIGICDFSFYKLNHQSLNIEHTSFKILTHFKNLDIDRFHKIIQSKISK